MPSSLTTVLMKFTSMAKISIRLLRTFGTLTLYYVTLSLISPTWKVLKKKYIRFAIFRKCAAWGNFFIMIFWNQLKGNCALYCILFPYISFLVVIKTCATDLESQGSSPTSVRAFFLFPLVYALEFTQLYPIKWGGVSPHPLIGGDIKPRSGRPGLFQALVSHYYSGKPEKKNFFFLARKFVEVFDSTPNTKRSSLQYG